MTIITAILSELDDPDFLLSTHNYLLTEGGGSAMRVLFYPPVPEDVPANTIRCGEHSDYGTITILMQDSMGGLQVRVVNSDGAGGHCRIIICKYQAHLL